MLEARGFKESLSDNASVAVQIDLEDLQFEGELSKNEFNQLIAPLVDKSIKACRRAVRDAGVDVGDVNNVVLVGGSTRVPAVVDAVAEYFDSRPLDSIDPDRVVAVGAAIQANVLVGNKPDEEMLLSWNVWR